MTIKNIKLKNANGDYLYPYTENLPTATSTQAGVVKVDATPTASSTNVLTSGGAKTALDAKLDKTATAAKATADANGNNIVSTYATKSALTTVESTANSAKSIAEGRSRGVSFATCRALIDSVNSADKSAYKVGDNLFVQQLEVPDLWVYSVENSSAPYNYENDEIFVEALQTVGFVQLGYFKVAMMETAKVDLSGYVPITRTVNGKNLSVNISLTPADVGALAANGTAVKATADENGKNINATYAKLTDIITYEDM